MYVCCLCVYYFRAWEAAKKETCNHPAMASARVVYTLCPLLGPLRWCTINMFRCLSLCLTRCIVQLQSQRETQREKDLFIASNSFVWFSFAILRPTHAHIPVATARTLWYINVASCALLHHQFSIKAARPPVNTSWKHIRPEWTKMKEWWTCYCCLSFVISFHFTNLQN
jgi:hypothetical protein